MGMGIQLNRGAASFSTKAYRLNNYLWIWVLGLDLDVKFDPSIDLIYYFNLKWMFLLVSLEFPAWKYGRNAQFNLFRCKLGQKFGQSTETKFFWALQVGITA